MQKPLKLAIGAAGGLVVAAGVVVITASAAGLTLVGLHSPTAATPTPSPTATGAPAQARAGANPTLAAADNPGGSGVKQIRYYATGAQPIGSASSPQVVTVSAGSSGAGSTASERSPTVPQQGLKRAAPARQPDRNLGRTMRMKRGSRPQLGDTQ